MTSTGDTPNVFIEATGESRQRLDVRFDPSTIASVQRVLARKKELARNQKLPEPTLTRVLERLVLSGISLEDQEDRKRGEAAQLERIQQGKSRT